MQNVLVLITCSSENKEHSVCTPHIFIRKHFYGRITGFSVINWHDGKLNSIERERKNV
jgi:hypothetical protein